MSCVSASKKDLRKDNNRKDLTIQRQKTTIDHYSKQISELQEKITNIERVVARDSNSIHGGNDPNVTAIEQKQLASAGADASPVPNIKQSSGPYNHEMSMQKSNPRSNSYNSCQPECRCKKNKAETVCEKRVNVCTECAGKAHCDSEGCEKKISGVSHRSDDYEKFKNSSSHPICGMTIGASSRVPGKKASPDDCESRATVAIHQVEIRPAPFVITVKERKNRSQAFIIHGNKMAPTTRDGDLCSENPDLWAASIKSHSSISNRQRDAINSESSNDNRNRAAMPQCTISDSEIIKCSPIRNSAVTKSKANGQTHNQKHCSRCPIAHMKHLGKHDRIVLIGCSYYNTSPKSP